jgi:hypothetical protein
MQNVRWNLTHRCGSLHTGSGCWENATHDASSAQRPGSQLNTVQYPPGAVVSQSRSPWVEQSVERLQASPISGLQPQVRSATPNKTARRSAGKVDKKGPLGKCDVT